MLPFYLEHYKQFAESITLIDNHSTDNSVAIARAAGANVAYFESGNEIRDDIMQHVKNTCWKTSKGVHHWAIVVDVDELLYHDNILGFLEQNTRADIFITTGYHMVCDTLPVFGNGLLCNQVRRGCADPIFCNKPVIFNPTRLAEVNFTVGCHGAIPVAAMSKRRFAQPRGVIWGDNQLKLLHYDYLTLDHRIRKCQARGKRQSAFNRERQWALQYDWDANILTADYQQKYTNSVTVC